MFRNASVGSVSTSHDMTAFAQGSFVMHRDWELLALQSPAVTAQAIQEALGQGEIDEASKGVRELAHVLGKSDERELRRRLTILMMHILKWRTQPPSTKSWRLTIRTQR